MVFLHFVTCMNQLVHIIYCTILAAMVLRLKKNLRLWLWLWWAPQHQLWLSFKKEGYEDDSTESLLAGRYLEVPRGFLAVYVGPELRRFVIPTSYLSMPDFKALMERMAEEFGYYQEGGLQIPCEEEQFEEILDKCFTRHQTKTKTKTKTKNKNLYFKIGLWWRSSISSFLTFFFISIHFKCLYILNLINFIFL